MNFKELKELAKRLGGIVVMADNQPDLVVLSYAGYKNLIATEPAREAGLTGGSTEEIERLNKEISVLKDEIRQREEAELINEAQPVEDEELELASSREL